AVAGTNFTGLTSFDFGFINGGANSNTHAFQTLDDNGSVVGSTTATITLSIGIANGDTIGGTKPATITINDKDRTPFTLAQSHAVNENVGSVLVTVTRNGPASGSATVQYQTLNGTALSGAGNDYLATSGTLTFSNNQTTRTFGVTIVNDSTSEPQESFSLH